MLRSNCHLCCRGPPLDLTLWTTRVDNNYKNAHWRIVHSQTLYIKKKLMGQRSGCVPFISELNHVWNHRTFNRIENEKVTMAKLDELGNLNNNIKSSELCNEQQELMHIQVLKSKTAIWEMSRFFFYGIELCIICIAEYWHEIPLFISCLK